MSTRNLFRQWAPVLGTLGLTLAFSAPAGAQEDNAAKAQEILNKGLDKANDKVAACVEKNLSKYRTPIITVAVTVTVTKAGKVHNAEINVTGQSFTDEIRVCVDGVIRGIGFGELPVNDHAKMSKTYSITTKQEKIEGTPAKDPVYMKKLPGAPDPKPEPAPQPADDKGGKPGEKK